jgi:hypothetical protein
LVAAACLSASDNALQLDPTDANVSGAFSLSSINGTSLPVLASVTASQEFDLLSDTVSIATDGTWTEVSVYKVTQLSDNTTMTTATVISGTYTIGNQQINFVQTGATNSLTFAGSVKGNRLTIVFGGSQFIYNRST